MSNKSKWFTTLTVTTVSLSFLLLSGVLWLISNFSNLDMKQIIFHLKVPLEGSDTSFMTSAIMSIIFPAAGAFLFTYVLLRIFKKKNLRYSLFLKITRRRRTIPIFKLRYSTLVILLNVAAMLIFAYSFNKMDKEFHFKEFLAAQSSDSNFIKENYVFSEGKLRFPEEKRNLIFLYLESMENTYSSIGEGGAFSENYIPELTEIAKSNFSFSHNNQLGGNLGGVGTGWTMASMFSHSTGLPLNIPVEGNSMGSYSSFFPGVESLGDVLQSNGYKNYLMIGSEAAFGGRELFFRQHGDYEILDYNWAKKEDKIPNDYRVWWGFEDQKLFSMAKEELIEISKNDEPFNFTMLTVDTHHQDGYVCELCENKFSEQYSNVIACSSRQVAVFIDWIKNQDFYENTTIVIVGDHRTMDSDFAIDLPEGYQRTLYNAFINVPEDVKPEKAENRKFNSYDHYPTTLASLGVTIDGDRLALGTNLFSSEKTLYEVYGAEMYSELNQKSSFYDNEFLYPN